MNWPISVRPPDVRSACPLSKSTPSPRNTARRPSSSSDVTTAFSSFCARSIWSMLSLSTSSDGGGMVFDSFEVRRSNFCRLMVDIASVRIRNASSRLITSTYGISHDMSSSSL